MSHDPNGNFELAFAAVVRYRSRLEARRRAESLKTTGHAGAHIPKYSPTLEGEITAILQALLGAGKLNFE